jgi:hypothetical protein
MWAEVKFGSGCVTFPVAAPSYLLESGEFMMGQGFCMEWFFPDPCHPCKSVSKNVAGLNWPESGCLHSDVQEGDMVKIKPLDEVVLDQGFAIWGGFVQDTKGQMSLVRLWRLDGSPGEIEMWCSNSRLLKKEPHKPSPQSRRIVEWTEARLQ